MAQPLAGARQLLAGLCVVLCQAVSEVRAHDVQAWSLWLSHEGASVARKKIPTKQRSVEEALEVFREAAQVRYRIAMRHFEAQDAATQEAMEQIRDRLLASASGLVRVFPNGKKMGSVAVEVEWEYISMNALYMATELFKDMALMDIRVENYKFPPLECVECGARVSTKKKRHR